ncbi:hypothetical protein RAA17_01220 [Komagataeibacter rhaeticus]|nr:hypothetical protein [Komagataeibacter rhaeticus]
MRALHCLIETECAAIGEWDLAREEHIQASRYHTQHFRTAGHFNAVESYATALEQLSRCQSRFGRFEFENIVNHMAFSVIMAAHEQGASIADLLRNGAARPVSSRVAGSLKKRARAHVATGTDPCGGRNSMRCWTRLKPALPCRAVTGRERRATYSSSPRDIRACNPYIAQE